MKNWMLITIGCFLSASQAFAFGEVIQCKNFVMDGCYYEPYEVRGWVCEESNLPLSPNGVPYVRVQSLKLSVDKDSVHAIESLFDTEGNKISERPLFQELTGMTCIEGASNCESRDRKTGVYLKQLEDRESRQDYFELIFRQNGKSKVLETYEHCQ